MRWLANGNTPSAYSWSWRLRSVRAGLGEAIVHVDSVSGGDPLQHAVENDLAVFVFVESQIAKIIQHPCGLRDREGVNPRHITRQRIACAGAVRRSHNAETS